MAEKQLKEIAVADPPANHSSKPPKSKRQKLLSSPWFWFLAIGAIVKVLMAGLLIGLYYKHSNPRYHVDEVQVKTSLIQYPEYDITLKSENKNHLSTIVFDEEGDASLLSEQKTIAKGKYRKLKEKPRSSHDVSMILHGSTILPIIEPSLNFASVRERVPLYLSIDVPMKVKIGALKVRKKNIKVKCSFTLDKLAKDTKILGQSCITEG